MKIKDVVLSALRKIGREDLAIDIEEDDEPYEEPDDVVRILLYCVNATENELARYYFPLRCTETLQSDNGKFAFANFSHVPCKILSVKAGGRKKEFRLTAKELIADADRAEIEYNYVPAKKNMEDESDFNDLSDGEITALGAAAEYFLICGEPALAKAQEERYRSAINRAMKTAANGMRVPPRRWI